MSTLSIHTLTRRVDLFTLRLFLTVVEEGQIRKAAVRENIAPSAATKRIQDLEEIAGLPLFERQPAGVVPNAAGVVLARYIRELFGNLEEMRRELGEYSDGVRGSLTVATTGSLIVQYVAKEIGEFSRNYPQIDLALEQHLNPDAIRAVVSGGADLAIYLVGMDVHEEGLDVTPYRTDRLVALAPAGHPLAEKAGVTLADLLGHAFISVEPSTAMMADISKAAKSSGLAVKPKFHVTSVEAARSLVEEGLGVTIQPECMLPVAYQRRVSVLRLDEAWALRKVHIGTRRGRAPTAATRLLIEQLIAQPRGSDATLEAGPSVAAG
ncbi:LysR family transcriptional regulator [Bordetella parapertussis]|uniref:Transcriptional regulator n=3 Tax=Bordetella TaxID=517 RepID=A0A0H3LPX7_BORBR|nr:MULTISPECIES: LysR family transcriptional regulator [Bordetella]KAK62802.1 LysR substrate-binding domain protein [Bordetella bronchiseptica 980-2]AMG89987.1 LysR family transcriptional regulator [Bordetella bronchiseptica]AOB40463.1 transcriptional regulator [Bordetella parapertussis]AUL44488.1 transcriptional regulator [Bordetella parapertussis]AWP64392.1 transcriptional regulator [Bordetella parapertussis]